MLRNKGLSPLTVAPQSHFWHSWELLSTATWQTARSLARTLSTIVGQSVWFAGGSRTTSTNSWKTCGHADHTLASQLWSQGPPETCTRPCNTEVRERCPGGSNDLPPLPHVLASRASSATRDQTAILCVVALGFPWPKMRDAGFSEVSSKSCWRQTGSRPALIREDGIRQHFFSNQHARESLGLVGSHCRSICPPSPNQDF